MLAIATICQGLRLDWSKYGVCMLIVGYLDCWQRDMCAAKPALATSVALALSVRPAC